ncbi:hypothetical protein AK37_21556 [Rhodococcus pyridinivorans AK37]|uniref:Uncharacterized protein n=1 Tax=Rhodococcus pyridinivorans AK37 TaxID=1114960 RepID=H0JX36_9NOCA|nr:hypothetical protein AK37_21556 [Rhodococcus pyridinivorans AK37]
MEDAFVACPAGTCPAGGSCCHCSFNLDELIIDRFVLIEHYRGELGGCFDGTSPLPSSVVPPSVPIFT